MPNAKHGSLNLWNKVSVMLDNDWLTRMDDPWQPSSIEVETGLRRGISDEHVSRSYSLILPFSSLKNPSSSPCSPVANIWTNNMHCIFLPQDVIFVCCFSRPFHLQSLLDILSRCWSYKSSNLGTQSDHNDLLKIGHEAERDCYGNPSWNVWKGSWSCRSWGHCKFVETHLLLCGLSCFGHQYDQHLSGWKRTLGSLSSAKVHTIRVHEDPNHKVPMGWWHAKSISQSSRKSFAFWLGTTAWSS